MARSRASFLLHIGLLASVAGCFRAPARAAAGVTDDWGRALRMAPARRIVSLQPATTELVFALGLGDRLVGRTTWCDYPPAALRVTDVGAGIGPNVEAIAAVHPDLVLLYASEANRDALRQLGALGIGVAVLRVDLTADMRRAAHVIATLAGVPGSADSLLAVFDSAMASARRFVVIPAPRTSHLAPSLYVDIEPNPPITVGAGSFLSEVIAEAGARNVFDDITRPSAPVSLEAIVARDPDAVLVLTTDTAHARGIAARPGWRALSAVRDGRIIAVNGSLFGRPSPRMPQAVAELASRLASLRAR